MEPMTKDPQATKRLQVIITVCLAAFLVIILGLFMYIGVYHGGEESSVGDTPEVTTPVEPEVVDTMAPSTIPVEDRIRIMEDLYNNQGVATPEGETGTETAVETSVPPTQEQVEAKSSERLRIMEDLANQPDTPLD